MKRLQIQKNKIELHGRHVADVNPVNTETWDFNPAGIRLRKRFFDSPKIQFAENSVQRKPVWLTLNFKKNLVWLNKTQCQSELYPVKNPVIMQAVVRLKMQLANNFRLTKIIGPVILLVIILFMSFGVNAQVDDRYPRLKERITEMKLRRIRENLNLDPGTFEQFRPVYLRYDQEMMSLDFRKMGKLLRVNADSLSDEEADQLIVAQIEQTKKMLSIREKYYPEFRKVLKPQQVIRLYQTENEIRKRVMAELKKRRLDRK